MERAPELEALQSNSESGVADRAARGKQRLAFAMLATLATIGIYMVFASRNRAPRDMLDSEESFNSTTFTPPGFVRNATETETDPAPEPNIVVLPLPPAEPEPVAEPLPEVSTFTVPPPPMVVPTPSATEPTVVVTAPLPIEEEEFPERYLSGLVVMDVSKPDTGLSGPQPFEGQAVPPALVSGTDSSSKFLAASVTQKDRAASAAQMTRIDALIAEGTMISGLLETAINSDLPGQIRAVVNEDLYSLDGRRMLIPIGSRLIGEYQSEVMRGQTRVFVVWSRLIRSDGVTVRLDSIGADSLGRSGMTGFVDTKFKERLGSALLLSILGGAVNYLADSSGVPEVAAGAGNEKTRRQRAADGIAQTMADFVTSEIEANSQLKPTISIDQGERIFVYVRQDLSFAAMYDDPVTEAMRQIINERR